MKETNKSAVMTEDDKMAEIEKVLRKSIEESWNINNIVHDIIDKAMIDIKIILAS